jgi:hypothetical protein
VEHLKDPRRGEVKRDNGVEPLRHDSRDTARSKRFIELHKSHDASECACGMRIETTWTAWGNRGHRLDDRRHAISVNDRRASCPSTARLSPGCGNLGAAASILAVCWVVSIRAGYRSGHRACDREQRSFLVRVATAIRGEAVNVRSAPVPGTGVAYSHDVRGVSSPRSRKFVRIGPR